MSTPESTSTHLPWATLCQSRPLPYARVDFIPQSGSMDLASSSVMVQIRINFGRLDSAPNDKSDPQKNSEMLFEKVLDVLF